MDVQKYNVNQHLIETLLSWVKSGEIAIPEIQRPYVWKSSKVRDLIDSLYQGFPIGYVITWRSPNTKLKDGSSSEGKKILIDGQQRVTALTAAILGQQVVNKDYQQIRIKIAFNPVEERFDVQTPVILRNKVWIPDIAEVISGQINHYEFITKYTKLNPEIDINKVSESINRLLNLSKKQIGMIELSGELDIETVTEIFIRINSKGTGLSQADFAMSKIAANEIYQGNILRKAIDYFCHAATSPDFVQSITQNDKDFSQTSLFNKMTWLKNQHVDIYAPSYVDMLRVAFTSQFTRGKMSDLVSLLSGRNFTTRHYEEAIAKQSFSTLRTGILEFINETNFKRFIMTIKSAGFINPKLIRSGNALNFAYIVYLKLREKGTASNKIETYVRKWFVYSILTGRYSGSPESMFDFDIRQIENKSFEDYLREKEEAELSSAFWEAALIQSLNTSVTSSPYFHVYLAAQIKNKEKGFLSKDFDMANLIQHRGDVHHIFPKSYLKNKGLPQVKYNQIANYVYMQQEVNIKIGNKPPRMYFNEIKQQTQGGKQIYGGIDNYDNLKQNLKENCVPESVFNMDVSDYEDFLAERRGLMANKIKEFYYSL